MAVLGAQYFEPAGVAGLCRLTQTDIGRALHIQSNQRRDRARRSAHGTILNRRRLTEQRNSICRVEFIGANRVRQWQAWASILPEIDADLAMTVAPKLNE